MHMTTDPGPGPAECKRRDRLRALAGNLVARELADIRLMARVRAQLQVSRVGRDPTGYCGPSDLGPGIVLERGERESATVADPDRPCRNIRRTRRADGLARLWREGRVTTRQWDAAEAFRETAELAQPLSRSGEFTGFIGGWTRACHDLRQGAAAIRVAQTLAFIGSRLAPVFVWVVLCNGGLRAWEESNQTRNGSAMPQLIEGLERLVAYDDTQAPRTRRAARAARGQDAADRLADRQPAQSAAA